jgi:endonuclease YncB( thermonuclease family)
MGGADHLGQPIGKFALRFFFLALLMIAGILGAVVLMQKGQAHIVAGTTPANTVNGKPLTAGSMQAGALPSPATPPPMERMPADPAAATAPAELSKLSQAQTPGVAPASQSVGPVPETAAAAPAQTPAAANKPDAQKQEPPVPIFQVLARPAAVAAGILETTRGRVTLKDVASLDPATLCGTGASAWPCGQLALTQFRRFLRGRYVTCDIADPAWEGAVTARCKLGKEDLAAWLVENGWVRAEAGSEYEKAGHAAEAGKRGVFGPDPRHP